MAFGTRAALEDSPEPLPVSILVFLEWPLGPSDANQALQVVYKFQSLFFWNGLWDGRTKRETASLTFCFNPCFSGMAFGTRPLYPCMGVMEMFQSLFFWNGLWDANN